MKRLLCVLLGLALVLYAVTSAGAPFRVFERGPCAGGVCEVPVTAVVKAPDQTAKKPDQAKAPDQTRKVPPVPPSLRNVSPQGSGTPSVAKERRLGGAVRAVFRRR